MWWLCYSHDSFNGIPKLLKEINQNDIVLSDNQICQDEDKATEIIQFKFIHKDKAKMFAFNWATQSFHL